MEVFTEIPHCSSAVIGTSYSKKTHFLDFFIFLSITSSHGNFKPALSHEAVTLGEQYLTSHFATNFKCYLCQLSLASLHPNSKSQLCIIISVDCTEKQASKYFSRSEVTASRSGVSRTGRTQTC